MKSRTSTLLLFIVGLASGLLIGRQLAPRSGGLDRVRTTDSPPPIVVVPQPGSGKPTVAADSSFSAPTRLTLHRLDQAIDEAWNEISDQGRQDAVRRLADALDLSDIPAALAHLAKSPEPVRLRKGPEPIRALLTSHLLRRWVGADVAAALAYAQALPSYASRLAALQVIVEEWTQRDWPAVAQWAKQLPTGQQKSQLLLTLVNTLARLDPKAALSFVESLGPTPSKRDLQSVLLRGWARKDPAAAADAPTRLSVKDGQVLAQIARHWIPKDPQAAIAWVKSFQASTPLGPDIRTVAYSLAVANPKMAMDFASSLPAGGARNDAIQTVFMQFGETDLEAAINSVRQLPDQAKVGALSFLTLFWTQTDPKGIAELAATLPPVQGRDSIMSRSVSAWALTDPQLAAEWAMQLPDEKTRSEVLSELARGWARHSPEEAAQFAMRLPSDKLQESALLGVVRSWGETDPQAAAAWVSRFPEGNLRDEAVDTVISLWARNDSAGAAAWLETLPTGKTRDAAVRAYADAVAVTDAAAAISWAQSIGDEPKRHQAMEWAASIWLERDERAARAWIEGSPLPEESKQRLLERRR
jgi:hypothetical protein